MTSEKVYITACSALSAAGHDLESHWEHVLAGQSKIDVCKAYDFSTWPSQLAGEISDFNWQKALPDRKQMKVISKQDIMGLYAAHQVADKAGLTAYLADAKEHAVTRCDRTAVFVGSPGNKYFQQYDFLPLLAKAQDDMQAFAKHLFETVHPMWLLRILPNNVLAYAGINLHCKGVNHNVTNHAVGGLQALIEAYWSIQTGQADRAIVIAYDIGNEPQARFYYEQLGVLSPDGLSPFDSHHNGTVLAEGAVAIILENQSSIAERQVKPVAELLIGKSSSEGQGLFSLQDDGLALAELMQDTLNANQLTVSDIDVVIAHANGNQKSDDSEALAIQAVFGDKGVAVTGFKWLMGHTLCASGLLDLALAAAAIKANTIPALATCHSLAPTCQGLDVVQTHRTFTAKTAHALIINRGFASMNVVAIIKGIE